MVVFCTQVTGLLASSWNIPMFGFVSQTPKLDNTRTYDTYVKMVSPLQRMYDALEKTLKHFTWKYVALLGGSTEGSTWDKIDELWTLLESQLPINFVITVKMKCDPKNPDSLRETLSSVASLARVIVLVANSEDSRLILLEAEKQGLIDGIFVFIMMQQFEVSGFLVSPDEIFHIKHHLLKIYCTHELDKRNAASFRGSS
ncbi:guanylate cyclase 2G-like [Ranitomeya variabilis]|uniref:guanylate cyclase 2G-like n=1 Tax=Ranitomeya variabilis TaxID=490064 RepID=UPI0040571258